jgi:protein-disulfide isomerase
MKTWLMAAALMLLTTLASGSAMADEATEEMTPAERARFEAVIREYLLEHPEVIIQSLQEHQRDQRDAQAELQRRQVEARAAAIYGDPRQPVIGNPDGSLVMVEFFDYNCGYCKRSLDDVMTLLEKNPELKVVMIELPILHPTSEIGARAALAAREQGKYREFHTALMALPGRFDEARIMDLAAKVGLDTEQLAKDMDSAEIRQQIADNRKLAGALGINGTPAFIVGDELIPGAVGRERLQSALDGQDKG